MSIKIKLFASLAESLERREATLDYHDGMTVAGAWTAVSGQAALPAGVLMAVNMAYCDGATVLTDGDEVAYFPPVTGGVGMPVKVTEQALQPWTALADFEQNHPSLHGSSGASAVFVGSMRDFNEGDTVRAMTLEHYPGMTERHLDEICADACARWDLIETLVIHRVGTLEPGDPIVLVAVWSAHRAAAFEASRFIMEDLKSRAPFWKKELLEDGQRWVTQNTPGTTGTAQ